MKVISTPNAKAGWVYLLRCGWYYKIGKANNVKRRTKELQTASPFLIELMFAVFSDDNSELEAVLHEVYSEHRTNGEWFELPPGKPDDVIANMKLMSGTVGYDRFIDDKFQEHHEPWDIPFPTYKLPYSLRSGYVGKAYRSWTRPRLVIDAVSGLCVDYAPGDMMAEASILNSRPGDYIDAAPLVGERVRHQVFGEGIVLELRRLDGMADEALVSFRDRARRLIVGMAGLMHL